MSASCLQHLLDPARIARCCDHGITQMTLPLRRLLGQDVALICLTPLHLVLTCKLEALRRAPIGFHFRHFGLQSLYLRGDKIMIMVLASIIGADSTLPMSCTTSENFISTSRPSSGCAACLPRNIIVTLTLLPSSRNRRACRTLNSRSCGSMPGRSLTSFTWI